MLDDQPIRLQESRYRQRYLDTIVNGHVRDIFVTRARIIRYLRSYFDERGFLEVRTCRLHVLHVSGPGMSGIGMIVLCGQLSRRAAQPNKP